MDETVRKGKEGGEEWERKRREGLGGIVMEQPSS